MHGKITVVYEKGVLRPLHPLYLPEQTQLEIHILTPDDSQLAAYQVLVQAGLIKATPASSAAKNTLSEREREVASDDYARAGSLSELIIAERDEA